MSPPARGRGLKLALDQIDIKTYLVAPRAGAWIETGDVKPLPGSVVVTKKIQGMNTP